MSGECGGVGGSEQVGFGSRSSLLAQGAGLVMG